MVEDHKEERPREGNGLRLLHICRCSGRHERARHGGCLRPLLVELQPNLVLHGIDLQRLLCKAGEIRSVGKRQLHAHGAQRLLQLHPVRGSDELWDRDMDLLCLRLAEGV